MAVQILKGFYWGVDEESVAQGSGAGAAPQVVSAVSIAPDRVRVTFNQAMNEESIGRFQDYRIIHTFTGVVLGVVGAEVISALVVDLITDAQKNANYDLTVTRVKDFWDVPINNSANNTASFAGTNVDTLYPSATSLRTFYGLESGMQAENQVDFNPDLAAPVLQNHNPLPTETNVAKDANIIFEVVDVDNGVDPATVVIYVDGTIAWQSDSQQNSFVVTKSTVSGGFRYEINPPVDFLSYATVTVRVLADDNAPIPNSLDTSYTFRAIDYEAPYLTSQDPFPGQTNVSPIAHVKMAIRDAGDGVDPATVVITIDGTVAWTGDAVQPGFVGSKSVVAGGYYYDLQPTVPFDPYVTIPVAVVASDLAPVPNNLNTAYSFTTTTDIPPQFDNLDPDDNETEVDASSKIVFDLTDNVGIDEASVLIFINGVLAYENSAAKNGYVVQRTPILYGYNYEFTPPVQWRYGSTVEVVGSARDTLFTLGERTWTFDITADPFCFEGPLNDFETSLLDPFTLAGTSLEFAEKLRVFLLASLSGVSHLNRAMRTMYLRAHSTELAPILRQLVPTPTSREQAVRLCGQRSNVDVELDLRSKPWLLPNTLRELQGLGLPVQHVKLLDAYRRTEAPNTVVPLACLLVFLAKALENNELV